ncbi:unnamed protein product [Coregonus sp. 'balchen']|nr:unnamed protein product [Coregonus sp. 'balchen']
MEHNNGDTSSWAMQRRMEGLVNKHMADIALETLQQRLSAVSDEMNNLAEHVSRRSEDIPKDDISRRPDVSFDVESLSATFSTGGVGEKLLMPATSSSAETAAQRKIISLLVEIKEEQQRQWAVLRELQARVQGQSFPEVEEEVEALDIDIPLRTLEQLDDTERHLEDAGAQKRMVSHLSRMGGATVDDAVRRLLQAVLTFAVGSELNWNPSGQRGHTSPVCRRGEEMAAVHPVQTGREWSTALQTTC